MRATTLVLALLSAMFIACGSGDDGGALPSPDCAVYPIRQSHSGCASDPFDISERALGCYSKDPPNGSTTGDMVLYVDGESNSGWKAVSPTKFVLKNCTPGEFKAVGPSVSFGCAALKLRKLESGCWVNAEN